MALRTLMARLLVATGSVALGLSPLSTLDAHAAGGSRAAWSGSVALPPAHGTGLHRNEDGEPGLAVTPNGRFWVASDIAPYAGDDPRVDPGVGLLSGADIWTSADGGRTYTWVSDPFAQGNTFGLAGEDTDLAVASEKNSNGTYNVYATSLWIGSSSLAWSDDDGKTWSTAALAGVPAQDRPWLAADGWCTVYLAYHQLPTFTPVVDTFDVCNGTLKDNGGVPTIDPTHQTDVALSDFPGLTSSFNKLTVDTSPISPRRHTVYLPMSVCKIQQPDDLVTNAVGSNCPKGTEYVVAVSTDNAKTFTDYPVVNDPSGANLVWAATTATDALGNVYFVWSDSRNSYLDVSSDGGRHWTKPVRVNPAGTTAVYPTVAGGAPGRVDIAWYGTNRTGNSNDAKRMGKPGTKNGAPWAVYLSRSTDMGRTMDVRKVSATIHRGYLCTHGGGCNSDGSRNLLDDFGVAISPTTGRDSIAFTDDQPDGKAAHAFTAYTTELPTAERQPRASNNPRTTGNGSSTAGSLPRTGTGPAVAIGGLGLLLAGLALRRRQRATERCASAS